MKRWKWVLSSVLALIILGMGVWAWSPSSFKTRAGEVLKGKKANRGARVVVVHPTYTELDRRTVEQGTVQAHETVELFAEVSGFLKSQSVDIGDVVKEGQLLARINIPEVDQELNKAKAQAVKARARVTQMQKAQKRAEAEYEVAKESVPAAEATLANARAIRRYRSKQLERIRDLHRQNAVEARLVDETEERYEAAVAGERSSESAIVVARSQVGAAQSKIEQAKADVEEAEAEVLVADAEVERMKVRVDFSFIRAPFPGIITKRYLFPGAFVRSAAQGERVPLLAVDRIDRVRVVVQIPDRHIPFADKGDPATITIENLGGKTYQGTISRIQGSEDQATRTMRIEIDLPNPTGELRPGMFARVDVNLQHVARALVLPSGCLVGEAKEGQGAVYVVRAGKAVLTPVRIGVDNGVVLEVLSGLAPNDDVVRNYSGTLTNGAAVRVEQ
jgi:RND family efflux transporter MFP subunit